ncbi:aromatic ring-hydroxylating dioxygenase subunit alpha [Mycobacterium sp. ITM-2016-00317]|uniref:aromatic ring-hydroxylating oxygenase subunit alpha n=1 Tax=Mycobacterium sp. ITM-2016-00317 TaxID=2099694 RepID=UPI00287F7C2C|nr:aromatic ring-hydroxylating dioxygenase subunit alpha [Mycobacterium sp. ITM-2016-00317]WNG87820.1 aromatic ring-hydroxylating dioxygenase subunit alpha [Mycobacterium sp. ITM-2016-00317]
MTSHSSATGSFTRLERSSVFSERVFADEMAHVFASSWLFVGHESEISAPGDYVTRRMGDDEVILCRGTTGVVNVLLNACAHRGTQLCRSDSGNAPRFTCMYHGWVYDIDGKLRGLRNRRLYPADVDRAQHGLSRARVATYRGLVFATWAAEAAEFTDWLGDMSFYLDALLGKAVNGWEVMGAPLRWRTRCNWKLSVENFAMDSLHLDTLHANPIKLGVFGAGELKPTSYTVVADGGHGLAATKLPIAETQHYPGYPDELLAQFHAHGTQAQRWFVSNNVVCKGNLFPNFSFIELVHDTTGDPDAPPTSGFMLRQAHPLGPTSSEIWMWILVPRDASEQWKRWSQESLVRTLGVSGTFEPDDLANGASVTSVNTGTRAGANDFLFLGGAHLESSATVEGHRLPGRVYVAPLNTEVLQRAFLAEWAARLADHKEQVQ